jgi:surface polysaccharide O-acyltransferase-like enzyme
MNVKIKNNTPFEFEGADINKQVFKKTNNNWFEEINYLRAIAIIAVLLIHTTDDTAYLYKLNQMTFTLTYIEELSRFAVPLFVFISGFVLYNKYKTDLPMKEFYLKRFTSIVLPYLIFSVIYNIIFSYHNLNLTTVIQSIFNANASGQFWYIKLIVILYIFYPMIAAYYNWMKQYFGKYTHIALFSSILILYLFSWYVYSLNIIGITSNTPLRFLVYFLFGIYVNDNYKQISEFLERSSPKKFVLLGLPIVILPFYLMFYWIDFRFHTQFTNYVTHYIQLSLIVEGVLYISSFVMFLYLLLHYKPQIKILHEVGNYSFGIYLIHAIFHNMLITYILPSLSISNSDLVYYVILFSGMALSSFYSVKLMSKHKITNFILTGKLQHATV